MEILRQMPCFTDVEPFLTKMSDFIPFTNWVLGSLGGDPPASVTAWLPLRMPKFVVSLIQLLQDCTTQKTI